MKRSKGKLSRRNFLKSLAMGATAAGLAPQVRAQAGGGILVEAESFEERGGWVLDQQFIETVGSAYLLAHGLGKPVANARTRVKFPAPGDYVLWVRTKNWVPGKWDPPGRFRVLVGGRRIPAVFGTEPGWNWQSGGLVSIKARSALIELEDETGFDGRCDALFFSADPNFVPPNEPAELTSWREYMAGRGNLPVRKAHFDVVIAGGGIAGCAAACAVASHGLKVALIHDRAILGGNASGEIRVHTEGIQGKGEAILKGLDSSPWDNGSPKALDDDAKREKFMSKIRNVRQFRLWRAGGVNKQGKRIVSIDARQVETGEVKRFFAPVFIDCTGDGWIGFRAGAAYRTGRESRDEFKENFPKYGELWSPKKPDGITMGNSLLWYSEKRKKPWPFPEVRWAMDVAKRYSALAGEWFWEYPGQDTIYQGEEIRDHLLRAIYGAFYNAKKKKENANYALSWVGWTAGMRESRRLIGDYVYTMRDMTESRKFKDAVAEETRDIDVHYQLSRRGDPHDFLAEALYHKVDRYFIPFRCLYSRDVENLLMAGRCFSCSHIGLGGPRVMRTTGQMGIAVGHAAAICVKRRTTPRGVYRGRLRELLGLLGRSSV